MAAHAAPAPQSPGLQEFCQKILQRAPNVRAVLIGTADGTPIVNALRKDVENKSFTDHLERELAQHFALAAVQADKMGMGNLRYTVTFYPQACLVHVNLAPLVVTLVHQDGQDDSRDKLNFGDALDLIPEMSDALEPLRKQVLRACWEENSAA
ncbi:unnamed protein product [Ectocarpus sp. 12 AP-2014]